MTTWEDVQRVRARTDCTCALAPGMDHEALRLLGCGCTSPRYVCPALDKYRRLTPRPPDPEVPDA